MKTLLPNSKKCLTASVACALFALAPLSSFSAETPNRTSLEVQINSHGASSGTFDDLLSLWQKRYGTHAVAPLLMIAASRDSDSSRYIAVMGAAKLGGPAVAPKLVPLLKDHSWMIRNAALKALAALDNPSTAVAVLPLLRDPALVVRVEAVESVRALQPVGSARALLDVLKNQENYHFGKSQWVPVRALKALAALGDRSVVNELRPLLDHQIDPPLQKETVATLEALTGHAMTGQKTLTAQIDAWKKYLESDQISTSKAAPLRH